LPRRTKLDLVIAEVISHLKEVEGKIDRQEVDDLIGDIESASAIFVYGAGRSGYVARSFAQRLVQIGFRAFFVGETISPSAKKGDLLIVVTGSGTTQSVVALVRSAAKLGLKICAISSNRNGPATRLADSVFMIPGKTKLLERATFAPFTSLFDIASLMVLDGMTAELMERKGVTDEDIGRTHANLE